MKHAQFPWRMEGDQILAPMRNAPEEEVICEPLGSTPAEAEANGRMIASVGDLFAVTQKVNELINCPDGVLKAEGKCVELLADLIRMCPEKIIKDATGFYN